MFVYNNGARDVRVHKEAQTLVASGRAVEVVCVLDRTTTPREERDGFTITRIDRNPPHYRLLRWARFTRANARRSRLRRRRRGVVLRLPVLRITKPDGATLAERLPRTVRRPYEAARWRVLRRVPRLRRHYYRRRAERSRAIKVADILAKQPQAPARTTRPLTVRAPRVTAPGPTSTWIRHVDVAVSTRSYRAVMWFHKPLMYLDYYRRAAKVAESGGFDAFHAHDLNTMPVAWLVARRTGKPLIFDAHELYPDVSGLSRRERAVWRVAERLLSPRATRVITVCESIAGELTKRHKLDPPTILLNCPPRTARPQLSSSDALRRHAGLLDSTTPIVLYQGGYAPGRGLEELIAAAEDIQSATLVLMGWGTIEEQLAATIRERGLEGRVRMVPPVPQQELLTYTAGADIGVIPYQPVGLNNYYTTPNKMFEYVNAGVAVAGSAVPEITRFVQGYGFGVTFDPYDPSDIARAINGLLADPEALRDKRRAAAAAAEQLNWDCEQRKLVSLYDELAA
ncbi:MAG: glycosyltransferase [Solirubrobacteraceae bacterium]|nr:glycosyltransferase [Solirubrobacteraceae bacterium]